MTGSRNIYIIIIIDAYFILTFTSSYNMIVRVQVTKNGIVLHGWSIFSVAEQEDLQHIFSKIKSGMKTDII